MARALTPLALICLFACSPDPLAGVHRRYATTCRPTGAPAPVPKLKLVRYLSGADIVAPVQMLPARDGTKRVFIVAQAGRIYVADEVKKDGTAALWLDISTGVTSGGEMGLLSMAPDPQFAKNGRFYLNYTTRQGGQLQTRISRFRVPAPPFGAPDPKSEQVLLTINQPYDNHNGGQIGFGPDSYLYIGMGDGGSGGDPGNAGQRMDTLLGKFLRIDVSGEGAYRIPPDNPFYAGQGLANGQGANNSHCVNGGQPGTCGEIWALGLRNPWRFSFDPLDGLLWTGDVGQGAREEVDIIERGKNYGWRCMEGTQIYNSDQSCKDKVAARAFTGPVHEYPRSDGKSISGGLVYRGRALPGLVGTYVFGDYVSGNIWGLHPGQGGAFTRVTLLPEIGFLSAFGEDADGEIYALHYSPAEILRLEAATPGEGTKPGWPERLSETGCFSDLPSRRLVEGALSFGVNAPLWADGAEKERALVLPEGSVMGYSEQGPWALPVGTVLIKTFVLRGVAVETRFLVWEGSGVRGATYKWNEDRSDAVLLSAGLEEPAAGQLWTYPSRSECVGCHTMAAGGILGLSTQQMNRHHDVFGTGSVSQIHALAQVGYLSPGPDPAAEMPRFPDGADETAPVASRARAYLHGNCAHCHMPGGLSNATIDVRAATKLSDSKSCGVRAQQGDLGVMNAQVLAPGKPDQSTLWLRMKTTDPATRMPNIGSLLPDEQGLALIRRWVEELPGCN